MFSSIPRKVIVLIMDSFSDAVEDQSVDMAKEN